MSSIKGHFDGTSIVLDEPASLVVGQQVRVVVESSFTHEAPPPRKSPEGFAKGMVETKFTPLVDGTATLMNGDEWDESAALHIDPLDAVPSQFVRRPGSAAGKIAMADDFNTTPDGFEDYI